MADFDRLTDRRGTDCLKYDFAAERGYPAEVLPFWVADMDFPTAAPIVKALEERARHGIFGYTDIKEDYKEILARWFEKRHGWQVEGEWLSITPGVVFGICTAIRAFTEPGEGVLICPPVYYPFAASIKANGRKLVESSLVEKDGHYEIDFQDFERKIVEGGVKLFVLCSPHNPVGRVWSRQELEQVAAICQKHQVLVVADEIHQDFVRPGHRHMVFASLGAEVADFTITCTSPSKTFNLAGLQISHIFISNESLRRRFRHELEAVGYGEPNAMAEVAAKAAYGQGEPWLTELLSYLEENLRRTRAFLAENLPQVKLIEPEGTYLLWLDCRGTGLSPEEQDEAIVQRGRIWLDEGRIFGKGGEGFQRINMACPWAILEEGLKRLAFALKK